MLIIATSHAVEFRKAFFSFSLSEVGDILVGCWSIIPLTYFTHGFVGTNECISQLMMSCFPVDGFEVFTCCFSCKF
jgi:hypothetical protein